MWLPRMHELFFLFFITTNSRMISPQRCGDCKVYAEILIHEKVNIYFRDTTFTFYIQYFTFYIFLTTNSRIISPQRRGDIKVCAEILIHEKLKIYSRNTTFTFYIQYFTFYIFNHLYQLCVKPTRNKPQSFLTKITPFLRFIPF